MDKEQIIATIKSVGFSRLYQEICMNHLSKTPCKTVSKKVFDGIFNEIGGFHYVSSDKIYAVSHVIGDLELRLALKVHGGLVEPYIFFITSDQWIFYGRFDFVAEEIDSNYDRNVYNLASYSNEFELKDIINGVMSIFKKIIAVIA